MTPETNSPRPAGCLSLFLLILAFWWVFIITVGRLSTQLTASAALTQIPEPYWALFPAIQGILLLPVLALLAWLQKSQPGRGITLTWMWGSLYVLLLFPISFLPLNSTQLQAALTTLLSLLFAFLVDRFTRRPETSPAPIPTPLDLSTSILPADPVDLDAEAPHTSITWRLTWTILPIYAVPWLAWGALGSVLDTLLMLVAGLAFGWAAYRLLDRVLLPAFAAAGYSPQATFLTGGFAAAILLVLLSSGLGFPFAGIQLYLTISLFPFGWIAVRFLQLADLPSSPSTRFSNLLPSPVPLLLGLAAAIPLAFIDPDELALVISAAPGEILLVGIKAAVGAALVGFVFALTLLIALFSASRKTAYARPSASFSLPVGVIIVMVLAVCIYLFAGQPGFFGEGLFVLLEDQADLSTAAQITDPAQRRQFVYDTLVAHATASQADIRQQLDRFGVDYTPYYLVNGIHVQGGLLAHLWLLTRPEVSTVLTIPNLRPLPALPPQSLGSDSRPTEPQWNLTNIHADRVWQDFGVTGAGVVIGQSDSGVQWDHPELADSYRGRNGDHNFNWYDPWYGAQQPQDINGHGTHTLGSVLGNSTGVAPDAQWIACANLARNLGNPAYYLDCMQFMLAPFPLGGSPLSDGDPARGAQVLNNSWGCPEIEGCQPETLLPAVRALAQAGIFVVASAGNDGPFCASLDDPLAIYPEVFTVGAGDENGSLAFFSSLGPVDIDGSNRIKPDVIAPGELVLSAMPGGTYGVMSGTSMAGPHVAGVVALMWSANPKLVGDIERTRQILYDSSDGAYNGNLPGCPGATDIPSTAIGYGMIDAYNAVKAAIELK